MGCFKSLKAIVDRCYAQILCNFRFNMERNTWGGDGRWYESEECESKMLIRDTGRFKLKMLHKFDEKILGWNMWKKFAKVEKKCLVCEKVAEIWILIGSEEIEMQEVEEEDVGVDECGSRNTV